MAEHREPARVRQGDVRPLRRRLFHAFAAAAVAWSAFACVVELHRVDWLVRRDPWGADDPGRWRRTSTHVAAVERFAAAAAPYLPRDVPVAVASEPGPAEARFFRFLWLAYFLPGYDLRLAPDPADPRRVDAWLAYGVHLDPVRFTPRFESVQGGVYRAR